MQFQSYTVCMHQFEAPQSSDRLTPEEAREVMQLWEARQAELPTVRDIAEALKISPEQAARLVSEVRAKRQDSFFAPTKRAAIDDRGVFVGGLAAAVCVTVLIASMLLGPRAAVVQSPPTLATPEVAVTPPTPPYFVDDGIIYLREEPPNTPTTAPVLKDDWLKKYGIKIVGS